MTNDDRHEIKLQARRDGKAVYYRQRAVAYRADARCARGRGANAAACKLDSKANAAEATADRLIGLTG